MRNFLLISILILCCTSCHDFFEDDISGQTVTLISPANGTTTTQLTHTFIWNEIKYADSYHLQIAYPTFSNIQYYIADTNLTTEQFLITLSPGTYQWKVKAVNSASETAYSSVYDLTIDTTSDLSYQSVVLISPSSGRYINSNLPSFIWQQMSIADKYNIIVKSSSNWTTGSTIINDTVTTPYYNLTTGQELSEGTYTWGVRAINSLSYTYNYNTATFYIDTTSPPTVTLTSPTHNSLQTLGSITFTWQQGSDIGNFQSPRTDSFYLYADTAMTTILYRDASTSSAITKTVSNTGMYRWFVKSYDAAGNGGISSSKFDFVIQ